MIEQNTVKEVILTIRVLSTGKTKAKNAPNNKWMCTLKIKQNNTIKNKIQNFVFYVHVFMLSA